MDDMLAQTRRIVEIVCLLDFFMNKKEKKNKRKKRKDFSPSPP